MRFDLTQREQLVERLLRELPDRAPGSTVFLRGSLAERRADYYSDIDILWDVPDHLFAHCDTQMPAIISAIHPIESIRSDPDFQNSDRRRLFFIRFADIPLFWRLDLDLMARSIRQNRSYDVDNPLARGSAWSLTESALANGVAALKAYLRHQPTIADELLTRAYRRVNFADPPLDLRARVLNLADAIAKIDPQMISFTQRIQTLLHEVLKDHLV
jgi:hypothetical protein